MSSDDPNTPQNNPTPDSSPTAPSDTPETDPEAQNTSTDSFTPESQNTPVSTTPSEILLEPTDPQADPSSNGTSKPESTEPKTAQTPVSEPLAEQSEPIQTQSKSSLARQLLITARNAIQFRKRKKLDRVMSLFLQQSKITNDEVEKFLHVSDSTATRYLSILEKEGRIKQSGKTGKGVIYTKL